MVAYVLDICQRFLLPCFYAFSACIGFTLIFNVHGKGKVICGLGGALGWLVYLLVGETILGAFVAALSIGFYSEIMARIRRYPVTGYLLISLLPLVPGGGIYYAMRYCVMGYHAFFNYPVTHLWHCRRIGSWGDSILYSISKRNPARIVT